MMAVHTITPYCLNILTPGHDKITGVSARNTTMAGDQIYQNGNTKIKI